MGRFLPKLGLMLFIALLPVALMAYPAYRILERLVHYSQATTVEAKLTGMDIHTVELGQDQTALFEARKHFDVVFYFKDEKEKKYAALTEMSWPAPGLKRRLENDYVVGETYTLFLLPDQTIHIDEAVAKDSFYRLTWLMALIFVGSGLFFMMWKRLAGRLPAVMPRFRAASEKSIVLGQLIALLISGLLAVMMSFSALMIPPLFYAGAYWGLVALLSLTLRLLVFADATPPPEPEPVEEKAPVRSSPR